ncbi:SDR family NAD(P)-dependent oxidoreductase [Kozakia baliensis]|uniref:SDR family NAD(P)-dependent oxidoreductase n=1 Tax=Kozakia baliensis TaxID=153496 RepID=UPI00345BEA56
MSRHDRFAKHSLAPRTILITGASGGVGAALAQFYASPGQTLYLWGRNNARLEAIAKICREQGAQAIPRIVDLCDAPAALAAFRETEKETALDLVILGAGVSDIRAADEKTEFPEIVLDTAMVNYATPVTLATEAARHMVKRGYGAIGLIGSVAAFHDLPFATAYSSSKAGLTRFATALHASLKPHGVSVTIAAPGYIDTAMSRRLEGARPFLVSPEKAAFLIASAIAHKKTVVIFPKLFAFLKLVDALTPRHWAHALLRCVKVKQKPLSES